jgi:hypothetical protein
MLVESSGKLDIAANGINGFADPEADQRRLEFVAEIPQDIEEASLLAMGPGQQVVDFIDHDHPQAEIAQEGNDTDLEGGDTLCAYT